MNGASRAVAMVTASVLAAIGVGVGIVGPSSGRKLVQNIPADAESALLTLSLRYSPMGTNPDSTVRDAITLRGPYSERSLTSSGSFGCGQSASPCSFVVDGVDYNRVGYGYGHWSARRIPNGAVPFGRWSTDAGDTLDGFEQDAVGGVRKVGYGLVGGVLTTEYRGDLSLPELYEHGHLASLAAIVYSLTHFPDPFQFPTLSAPISVWVDRNGQILQATGSAKYESPSARGVSAARPFAPTGRAGSTKARSRPAETQPVASVTATASVSDFGIPLHVTAPPRSDTTFNKIPRTTSATGRVSLSGHTAPGLLVLGLALEPSPSRNEGAMPSKLYVLASVASNGTYQSDVFGTTDGGLLRLTPYFYVGTKQHPCKVLEISQPIGKTTTGVNLAC